LTTKQRAIGRLAKSHLPEPEPFAGFSGAGGRILLCNMPYYGYHPATADCPITRFACLPVRIRHAAPAYFYVKELCPKGLFRV